MKKTILFLAVLAMLVSSCKDKHDYTPGIIEFSEDTFDDCFDVSNFNAEHEVLYDDEQLYTIGRHKFTHVYVSYNGNALGVWELPCQVPILDLPSSTDSITIYVVPCFKKNGQSSTVKGYGYIKSYQFKIPLSKGGTTKLTKEMMNKHYQYHQYTVFPFIETFHSHIDFSPYNPIISVVNFECIADPDNPSNRLGMITLTGDSLHETFEVATPEYIYTLSNQTYLEIRYKCESDMTIEIAAPDYYTVYPCGGLYATNEWQTVYINLDERFANIYNSTSLHATGIRAKILISGSKLENQDTHFYFDYVKIVTGPQS